MDRELEILKYAHYYEKLTVGEDSLYMMVNDQIGKDECLFGFCRLGENPDRWQELFSLLEKKAVKKGCRIITGPVNYTSWMSYRWTISNFDLKLFPDCDNPPYYPDYIRKLGYSERYTYRSADIAIENPLYIIGRDIYEEKLREGVKFLRLRGEQAYSHCREVYDISIDAFAGSYLYSEIPFEAFERIYTVWTRQVNVDLFIAYIDGKAVGYVMGYEHDGRYISKTSAVLKKMQENKIYLALLYAGCRYVRETLGYDNMIYHFQCEQRATFRRFDETIESNEKRYAVFCKETIK